MIERDHELWRNCYRCKVEYFKRLFLADDDTALRIQETSEPIVENGAVLEENPNSVAALDYDDDPGGVFAGFDDDDEHQGGTFGGFDDDYDYDDDLANQKGIISVERY